MQPTSPAGYLTSLRWC